MNNQHETTVQIVNKFHTDINYLGVLDYLDNNRGLPYKNPETPGIDATEKDRLLEIKSRGQAAVE